MASYLHGYAPILVFIFLAFGLSVVMVTLAFLRSKPAPSQEKLSTYECGFEPFSDSRGRFDVRFYLVSILFIIFDLEIAFLFPWALCLKTLGWFGFGSMIVFLSVLTIGFIYEWRKGALDWE